MLDDTARTMEPALGALGPLEARLRALADTPEVVAQLASQANRARDAHRAAIAALRAAHAALRAIGELPPWPAFLQWCQQVAMILPYAYLDHGPPSVDVFGHAFPF